MQVKKQQLELDMEQQTGSKSGKEYVKAVYCHPAYLTYMQSTSCKMPGWIMISFRQSCGISRVNVAMWVNAGTKIQKSWFWSGSATGSFIVSTELSSILCVYFLICKIVMMIPPLHWLTCAHPLEELPNLSALTGTVSKRSPWLCRKHCGEREETRNEAGRPQKRLSWGDDADCKVEEWWNKAPRAYQGGMKPDVPSSPDCPGCSR